jgi:predicted GTPase
MEKEVIKISITGNANIGKSRLSYLIGKLLKEEGFEINQKIHHDYIDENQFREKMERDSDVVYDSIKNRSVISIEESIN